ncbi:hypothetical protein HYU92_05445 [Candidatus Curtissbacteria bacterium]|nr:hypothetical protein [Candidatus Curtissbacteria bacterium]
MEKDPPPNRPLDQSKLQDLAQRLTIPLRAVPKKTNFAKFLPIVIIVLVVGAGIYTGLVFSTKNKVQSQSKAAIEEESLTGEQKQSFSQTFRDQAEGTLERNDELDKYAQGTHKLIRPGGEDQTAYLTSTVLDLDQYVGKKVKVYGETFGSSQVGWLMDVGKVEIIQ